mmetsp:Transcript_48329/g.111878  ORF Transcript_48329/g.111878 Transcript_48329/m.111878 type:complete len:209 (-) Transcript_48329:1582-2208(-)
MERAVLCKLDRVRCVLEDCVVRRRVIVHVDHACLLHQRSHQAGERRLLAGRVDRVEIKSGGAEDEQGAAAKAAVGARDACIHERQRAAPPIRAVKTAELRPVDDRMRTVPDRGLVPCGECCIKHLRTRAVEEIEQRGGRVPAWDPRLGIPKHAPPPAASCFATEHRCRAARPRLVNRLPARTHPLATASQRPAIVVEGSEAQLRDGVP